MSPEARRHASKLAKDRRRLLKGIPLVIDKNCEQCGEKIPESKRSDAKFCTERCRNSAEKRRFCDNNPEYVKRQRRLVSEIHHKREYGHTKYLDDPLQNKKDKYRVARSLGYRSGLEVSVAKQLTELGVAFDYESVKIEYTIPESKHKYTPDVVLPNGIIIETKGRFLNDDRKKHLLLKAQKPECDIRFVFSNSLAKLNKGSKTTYADWCNKNGFLFADKLIPEEWIKEGSKEDDIRLDQINPKDQTST